MDPEVKPEEEFDAFEELVSSMVSRMERLTALKAENLSEFVEELEAFVKEAEKLRDSWERLKPRLRAVGVEE